MIEKKLYGTKYGGFYLPSKLQLNDKSVVYCVGVGEDISFDVTLARLYNCDVHMFDPTPRAKIHVDLIKSSLLSHSVLKYDKRWGGGDVKYLEHIKLNNSNKLIFHDYGLFTENKIMKFYSPPNKDHVSYTLTTELRPKDYNEHINVQVKNLDTIQKELGHNTLDLLKIDIEGVECEVLLYMLKIKLFPKYICVDFDAPRAKKKLSLFNNVISELKKERYDIYHNDNFDITFIRH